MPLDLDELMADDEFDDKTFEGLDCGGANLGGKSFYQCEFRNLSAVEVDLSNCVFEDCNFDGCDLTMAVLKDVSLRGVQFKDSKLMGVDWSLAGGLTFAVGFENCVLSHGSFIDLRMKKTKFIKCRAHETNFAGVDLSGADFAETDLEGARFVGTDLSGADLSTALNYVINPNDNVLKKTRYSMEAALALASRMGVIVKH